MITGLDHVHIMCGELDKAVKYFEDFFEGKVDSRSEVRGLRIIRVNVQGVLVNLMETDPKAGELEPGQGRRGLDHFGFRVNNLEGLVKELKKKGARFEVDLSEGSGGIKYAFLEGPERIRIELVERP